MSDIGFDLSLSLGKMDKSLSRIEDYAKRMLMQTTPVFSRNSGVDTPNAGGIAVIDLGGPVVGYLREIRALCVGGLQPTTVAAGRADVYVTAVNPDDMLLTSNFLGLSDWRDFTAAMPSNAFYGHGEIVLHYPEKLILVLTGCTANQQYVAATSFLSFQDGPKGDYSL